MQNYGWVRGGILQSERRPMRKPIRITTPFPTTEEVARMMGVFPARTKEIEKMVTEIFNRRRKEDAVTARKATRNGGSTRRGRPAARARVS